MVEKEERVEHIRHRVRGVVRHVRHKLDGGAFVEVLWNGDERECPTQSGKEWLSNMRRAARADGVFSNFGPLLSTVPLDQVRPITAVAELGNLVRFWPEEKDIGRAVVYTPKHGPAEDGVITGFNDDYVFVRYKRQHPAASGQATRREDLRWLHE